MQDLKGEATAHGANVPVRKKVFLKKGAIPQITQIATAHCAPGCDGGEPHIHETMWEIYFVFTGYARFTVGEEVYEAGPGSFIAIPPNTLHTFKVGKDEVMEMFYFGVATD